MLITSQNLIRRVVMVCVGVFFLSYAISLLIYSNLGSDPATCMNLGIAQKVGLSLGNWQLIFNCIVLAVMFFMERRLIGIGTVINMVSIGYLIDFFRGVNAHLFPAEPSLALRFLFMAVGLILLALTAALYMYPQLGVSPYDSLGLILTRRLPFDFHWCRIGCDVLAVLIGLLCGSVVGVGTVLSAFCIGPLIKWFTGRLEELFPLSIH